MQPGEFFAQVEERQRASMPYLASLECATRGDIYATSMDSPRTGACRWCGGRTTALGTLGFFHRECYNAYSRQRYYARKAKA